jgi:riboflavin biosynthesis pyrimidine reductase
MRTVVITTSAGRDELTRRGAATLDSVEVHALNSSSGSIAPRAILQLLQSQFGVKTLLHEGGPTLFGQFLAADAVDELFLTLSPQIAGRGGCNSTGGRARGAVCAGFCAPVSNGQRQAKAAYLYLRYRRKNYKL